VQHHLLRIGLELPPLLAHADESSTKVDLLSLAEVARLAEDSGLGTLWLVEGGTGGLDPMPLAGSLAGATTTLGLGVMIRPSRGRHPSVIARDLTALDLLTGGRAAVALVEDGVGPIDIARLGEAASMLRLLFGAEEVTTAGRFYEVAELTTRPRPVSAGGPPIVVGVLGRDQGGDRSQESTIASTSADACVTGGTPHDVSSSRARLDGTAPTGERPMLLWRGPLGPDDRAGGELARSVLGSGADGIIAVLEPASTAAGAMVASAVGPVLKILGPLRGGVGS
jgi:alkanesulfonate monooxygenase SsuD/methylene tetrahydromethanopterin reductase-like flavin-dependent oxidoreductase (luciferase family)